MCWLASGTRYRIHDILGLLLYSMMKGKIPRCGTKENSTEDDDAVTSLWYKENTTEDAYDDQAEALIALAISSWASNLSSSFMKR